MKPSLRKNSKASFVLMKEAPITYNSSQFRFWENYLVRYLLGTIIGSIMVWILLWQIPESYVRPKILTKAATIDSTFLLMLGFAGFVYCYIASGFVLVTHSARWFLAKKPFWMQIRNTLLLTIIVCIFAKLTTFFIIDLGHFPNLDVFDFVCLSIGISGIGWQGIICYQAHKKFDDMYHFYKSLASARSCRSTETSDFVESYRHLREHGNAFFIVVSEIIFFFYVMGVSKLVFQPRIMIDQSFQVLILLIFLLFWVLPGVATWFLATKLERRFAGWDLEAPPC